MRCVPGRIATCRVLRKTSASEQPGNALDHHPTWKHVTSEMRRQSPARTDTMDTFVYSSWYFRALHRTWNEKRRLPYRRQPHAAGRSVYRRVDTRSCICCTAASSPRDEGDRPIGMDEPFAGMSPRHGGDETYQKADGSTSPSRSEGRSQRQWQARILLTTGEDISIGAIEKMSKSKRNTVDPDDIIGPMAPTSRAGSCCRDSPPDRDRDLERRARAGRVALRAAAVAWSTSQPKLAKAAPSARPARSRRRAGLAQGAMARWIRGSERHRAAAFPTSAWPILREFANALAELLGPKPPAPTWPGRSGGRVILFNCSRP